MCFNVDESFRSTFHYFHIRPTYGNSKKTEIVFLIFRKVKTKVKSEAIKRFFEKFDTIDIFTVKFILIYKYLLQINFQI